jgi:hypothetical protein
MLRAENDPRSVGHDQQQVHAHLEQLGCPPYPAFVDFLLRYAGLEFNVGDPADKNCERYRLCSLNDSGIVAFDEEWQQWRLDVGALFETALGPDGAVYEWLKAHYGHPAWPAWTKAASTMEVYIEQRALRHWVKINQLPSDGATTSHPDAAARIAEAFGLQPVVEASDDVGGWWSGKFFLVQTSPICLPFGKRYSLGIYWVEKNAAMERALDAQIASLVEPSLAAWRTTPEFYQWRRTGEEVDLDRIPTPAELPSVSFRVFARDWLTRCYETGQVDAAPPEDDAALHDYLRQNAAQWQRQEKLEPLYFAAAGLLAFGHKEYFEVMLGTMPRHAGTGWPAPLWAAKYFRNLMFELPFCPVDETAEALEWWREKSGGLQWSEEKGCYSSF